MVFHPWVASRVIFCYRSCGWHCDEISLNESLAVEECFCLENSLRGKGEEEKGRMMVGRGIGKIYREM